MKYYNKDRQQIGSNLQDLQETLYNVFNQDIDTVIDVLGDFGTGKMLSIFRENGKTTLVEFRANEKEENKRFNIKDLGQSAIFSTLISINDSLDNLRIY